MANARFWSLKDSKGLKYSSQFSWSLNPKEEEGSMNYFSRSMLP